MRRALPVPFLDLLFILLLAMLVLMIPKQPIRTSDIEQKAEVLVILEWPDRSATDLDLWMGGPNGETIYFSSKQAGPFSLARDDLGQTNDQYTAPDGTVQTVYLNQEIITIRALVPGKYRFNVHAYSWKEKGPMVATVQLIQLNPFKVLATRHIEFEMGGQELPAFSFSIGGDGQISEVGDDFVSLLRRRIQ